MVLGAAFKPNSDDVRDSPALDIAARIHAEGGRVVVHDPKALRNAEARFPGLGYEPDLTAALAGAEVVLLLTEWADYRDLDPAAAAGLVSRPRIVDGRNVLDVEAWTAAGWTVRGWVARTADRPVPKTLPASNHAPTGLAEGLGASPVAEPRAVDSQILASSP